MEETLTPDVVVNNTKLNIGNKTYAFYCKRKTKEEAELIKKDLIISGFDVMTRREVIDYHTYYLIWWRKN